MIVLAFEPLVDRRFRSENPYLAARKVFLESAELDGILHAVYPDAERTLCGLFAPDDVRVRPAPTCPVCVSTAIRFDEIDCSVPDHWRPDYAAVQKDRAA